MRLCVWIGRLSSIFDMGSDDTDICKIFLCNNYLGYIRHVFVDRARQTDWVGGGVRYLSISLQKMDPKSYTILKRKVNKYLNPTKMKDNKIY